MSDFSKMFEGFMKQGQEMAEKMGKDFAKSQAAAIEAMSDYMPEGSAEQMKQFVGDSLDAKTRALLVVAGQTAKGAEDTAALTAAINGAMAAGASKREISEAILQMTAVGAVTGVPKAMMTAMTVMAMDGGNS